MQKRETTELIAMGMIVAGGAGALGYGLHTKSINYELISPRELEQPTEHIQEIKDAAVSEEVKIGTIVFQCNKEIITPKGKKALLCFPFGLRSKTINHGLP